MLLGFSAKIGMWGQNWLGQLHQDCVVNLSVIFDTSWNRSLPDCKKCGWHNTYFETLLLPWQDLCQNVIVPLSKKLKETAYICPRHCIKTANGSPIFFGLCMSIRDHLSVQKNLWMDYTHRNDESYFNYEPTRKVSKHSKHKNGKKNHESLEYAWKIHSTKILSEFGFLERQTALYERKLWMIKKLVIIF